MKLKNKTRKFERISFKLQINFSFKEVLYQKEQKILKTQIQKIETLELCIYFCNICNYTN